MPDFIDESVERLKQIALTLPGRDDETTDTSRAYAGWGPDEDSTYGGGRTVRHADWETAKAEIMQESAPRVLHDFYFNVHTPTKSCVCCNESGISLEYDELSRGFYRSGGGRWSGWGDALEQDEIDLLVAEKRLGFDTKVGDVTPENIKEHLGWMGHDGINRYLVTPLRAKKLGIDTSLCEECEGVGHVPTAPTKLRLFMWTFAEDGTSRVDTAENVSLDELDEIREFTRQTGWEGVRDRFGWVTGETGPNIVFENDDPRVPSKQGRHWDEDRLYGSFEEFHAEFGDAIPAFNVAHDYTIFCEDKYFEAGIGEKGELPEQFSLLIAMTHPRKGASRYIFVSNCKAENGDDLKKWLRTSYDEQAPRFAWSSGTALENDAAPASAGA